MWTKIVRMEYARVIGCRIDIVTGTGEEAAKSAEMCEGAVQAPVAEKLI